MTKLTYFSLVSEEIDLNIILSALIIVLFLIPKKEILETHENFIDLGTSHAVLLDHKPPRV
jgi:hypothetical protein